MKRTITRRLCFIGAALLLAGCANSTPDRYPVIEAFHPDGSGGGISPDRDAIKDVAGSILSFAPGDEVEISLNLSSDVLHLEGPVTATLVVDRSIRIATEPSGMLISIEGGSWQPPLKAFEGAFGTGLSISRQQQVNRGQIDVTANER